MKCPYCHVNLEEQEIPDSDYCEECGNHIGDWK